MRELARIDALRGWGFVIGGPSVYQYGSGAAFTGMDVEVAGDASGSDAMNAPRALWRVSGDCRSGQGFRCWWGPALCTPNPISLRHRR
jgi:hypothetical protein